MSILNRLFGKEPKPAQDPDSELVPLHDEFHAAADAKDFERAVAICDKLIALRPEILGYRCVKAQFLVRSGRMDQAKDLLDDLLNEELDDLMALVDRSWLALEQRDFSLAIEFADRALKIDSRSAGALNNKAYAQFCTGYLESAIQGFRLALGMDSSLTVTRANLIDALLQLERFDDALYEANWLATKGKDRIAGKLKLSRIYDHMGQQGRALQEIYQALEIDSNSIAVAGACVTLTAYIGLDDELFAATKHFKSLAPSSVQLEWLESQVADFVGDYELADSLLANISATSDLSGDVHFYAATMAARRGNTERALSLVDEAVQSVGHQWNCLPLRWRLLVELGRNRKAIDWLDQLLAVCPSHPNALRLRALSACVEDDHVTAQGLLSRLPEDASAKYRHFHFIIAYNAGRFDEAMAALAKLEQNRSPGVDSLYRAAIHVRREHWKAAERELDLAMRIGITGRIRESVIDMTDQWQWLAGCHAHRAMLPDADRKAELAKAMEFYELSVQAGHFTHRFAWFQPRLHPLREVPEFRRACGQA